MPLGTPNFRENKEIVSDIARQIDALKAKLDAKQQSLQVLDNSITEEQQFIAGEEENSTKIDIDIDNTLKLKFLIAALEKKFNILKDSFLINLVSSNYPDLYKCAIRVMTDINDKYVKSKEAVIVQKGILLNLVRLRFTTLEDNVSLSKCDELLAELRQDKITQEKIIVQHKAQLLHMCNQAHHLRQKAVAINRKIKNLEMEYHLKNCFFNSNEVHQNRIDVANHKNNIVAMNNFTP